MRVQPIDPDLLPLPRLQVLLATSQFPIPCHANATVLHAESVGGVATRCLTRPNNLDNLPPLQPKIPRYGILLQNPRQLRLLQPIPLQQRRLLVPAQHDVLGHQLVVRDVDEQVVLQEALNLGQALEAGERLARRGRQGHVGDHDAALEVVVHHVLCEVADLRDAKRVGVEELDVDGPAIGRRVGVGLGRGRRGLAEHGFGRAG